MLMRLDKFLVNSGVGSRSEVKKYIGTGRVRVDQCKARPEMKVDPDTHVVTFDAKPVTYEKYVYLMLNKPTGVISATIDPRGQETTVIDLLGDCYKHLDMFPIGRLDRDTVGLVLLSNDGNFAHNTLSPKKHVMKTYFAHIDGAVNEEDVQSFHTGVVLEDGYTCKPAVLTILSVSDDHAQSTITVTISEGKFHQVKRMFESVGKHVCYLKRITFGGIHLDETLPEGAFRPLTPEEMETIRPFI